MKKERKLRLHINKVNVSSLHHILGGNDEPTRNDDCIITTIMKTVPGVDCKTGITMSNDTEEFCINTSLNKC